MQNLILGMIALGVIILIHYFFFRKEVKPQVENDAVRFARLLVAEIKLNNDYKVQRGLKNNNLYESMKDEIDEARNKYKKRISDESLEGKFDNALIEILADGDKNRLGMISTSIK